jgi:hypothetical protein
MRRRLGSSRGALPILVAQSGRVTLFVYRDLSTVRNARTTIRTLGALGCSRLYTRDRKDCYADNVRHIALAVEVVT